MKLFDALLKKKASAPSDEDVFADVVDEDPDEEYQLPQLRCRSFTMTEELERRRAIEELRKKCGVMPEKSGVYL